MMVSDTVDTLRLIRVFNLRHRQRGGQIAQNSPSRQLL